MSLKLIAGCGYLGFKAAEAWLDDGCEVAAFTRSHHNAAQFAKRGLQPLVLDLAAPDSAIELPAADTVLWAVGFDRTAAASREQVWLDGLKWLVNQLLAPPRRFIYISSTSVYGEVNGELVDESATVNPTSEGGQCCLQAEQMLRNACGEKFPSTEVVVLRMAGIFGPDRLLRRIDDLRNKTPLPGEPDHWLNLIHVDDAVRAIQYTSTAEVVPKVINVVNSETVTRRQYYSRLAELAGTDPPVFGESGVVTSVRQRGGNKRVVSRYADFQDRFEFNNVINGLDDSFQRTPSPR